MVVQKDFPADDVAGFVKVAKERADEGAELRHRQHLEPRRRRSF